jgi:hypothetical protein
VETEKFIKVIALKNSVEHEGKAQVPSLSEAGRTSASRSKS